MKEWASLVAQMVKNLPAKQKTIPSWEDPLEDNVSDNPLQYSCLENPRGQRSLAAPHERMNDFCWQ